MRLKLAVVLVSGILAGCAHHPPPQAPPVPPQPPQDPNATLVGGEIGRVVELEGTVVYVELGGDERILAEIDEIEFFRGPDGLMVAGRLRAHAKSAGSPVEGIDIDQREQIRKQGWAHVETFDDITFGWPAPGLQYQFERLRFRRLRVGDLDMLVVGSSKGIELSTGESLDYEAATLGNLLCPGTPVFACTNTACDTRCEIIERDNWIDDCNCPGLIACHWIIQGTHCWNNNCSATCTNVTGWSGACLCR